ncbi:MAG: hypothetical protein KGP29_05225 [Proteobacteria bacterium]|nr:hypothetical protein [Pseudomonadota bacterium]
MDIDTKFLTLFVFSVINFLILFFIKTRTSLVISVIIAHLVAVLFFSLSIVDYEAFREITLALIIYSMVILFIISNYGLITVESEKKSKNKNNLLGNIAACLIVLVVFLLIFFVVEDVTKIDKTPMLALEERVEIPTSDSIKKARMRENLLDNFLLKRSSDVILIIAAASTVLLLLSKKDK